LHKRFADKQFAEEINATINKLKFPKKAAKISPLTFSIVHLFHHLYGVDARAYSISKQYATFTVHNCRQPNLNHSVCNAYTLHVYAEKQNVTFPFFLRTDVNNHNNSHAVARNLCNAACIPTPNE